MGVSNLNPAEGTDVCVAFIPLVIPFSIIIPSVSGYAVS
jgi:hypothetical protein